MLNKKVEILTDEKFLEIYTNEKFRNEVSSAHGCTNKRGDDLGFKTCSYPIVYMVTPEQIKKAEEERERGKIKKIEECKGKLLLVGMGMDYTERYPDDICNHRVRGYFLNPEGKKYFIEVSAWGDDKLHIGHAIDFEQEEIKETTGKRIKSAFHELEMQGRVGKATKANILHIVNKYCNCYFTEIVIDSYNISCEDYISQSPFKLTASK